MSSRDGAGGAVTVPGRVGFSTVGALRRSDLAACEYRTRVSPLGADRVGAAVFCLSVV